MRCLRTVVGRCCWTTSLWIFKWDVLEVEMRSGVYVSHCVFSLISD